MCELVHRPVGSSCYAPEATGGHRMDTIQYYRAMEAFSRQHAKMGGECEMFWLAEAEVLAKLSADAHKLKVILDPKMKEEKGPSVCEPNGGLVGRDRIKVIHGA